MGKSFIRLIIILGCSNFVLAQGDLCVFKTKGTVLVEFLNEEKSLAKGDFIHPESTLSIFSNSNLTTIDAKGSVYFLDKEGDYSFNEIINHEKIKQNSSFTSRYLKYVWDQFSEKNSSEPKIAGVYRGEILMKFPKDSSKIANSKITLKWDLVEEETLYYVFVKNTETEEILKIETNGSQIALFDNNSIFANGDSFEWSVTTQAFPNLDNIPFNNFSLIDRMVYEESKVTFTDFINDLKQIGASEADIETILCENYGLCK